MKQVSENKMLLQAFKALAISNRMVVISGQMTVEERDDYIETVCKHEYERIMNLPKKEIISTAVKELMSNIERNSANE